MLGCRQEVVGRGDVVTGAERDGAARVLERSAQVLALAGPLDRGGGHLLERLRLLRLGLVIADGPVEQDPDAGQEVVVLGGAGQLGGAPQLGRAAVVLVELRLDAGRDVVRAGAERRVADLVGLRGDRLDLLAGLDPLAGRLERFGVRQLGLELLDPCAGGRVTRRRHRRHEDVPVRALTDRHESEGGLQRALHHCLLVPAVDRDERGDLVTAPRQALHPAIEQDRRFLAFHGGGDACGAAHRADRRDPLPHRLVDPGEDRGLVGDAGGAEGGLDLAPRPGVPQRGGRLIGRTARVLLLAARPRPEEGEREGADPDRAAARHRQPATRGGHRPVEVGEKSPQPRVAASGIDRQAAQEDAADAAGYAAAARRLAHVALGDVVGVGEVSVAGERQLAVQRLVHRDAEGELVRPCVGRPGLVLLRGHVRRGPEQRAGLGDRQGVAERRHDRPRRRVRRLDRRGRQAEVGDPDPAVGRDEDVGRLEVAVDDAGGVGGRQAAARGGEGVDDLAQRPPAVLQPHVEARAGDVLHRHEDVVGEGADLVDRHHVGMGELGHRLRLAQEALAAGGRPDDLVGADDLERDLAIERRVDGGEDEAHGAAAELRLDHVAPDGRAGGDLERRDRDLVRHRHREGAGHRRRDGRGDQPEGGGCAGGRAAGLEIHSVIAARKGFVERVILLAARRERPTRALRAITPGISAPHGTIVPSNTVDNASLLG